MLLMKLVARFAREKRRIKWLRLIKLLRITVIEFVDLKAKKFHFLPVAL